MYLTIMIVDNIRGARGNEKHAPGNSDIELV